MSTCLEYPAAIVVPDGATVLSVCVHHDVHYAHWSVQYGVWCSRMVSNGINPYGPVEFIPAYETRTAHATLPREESP